MARQLRIKFDGAWYHVMNRGINHDLIFFSSENRDVFLNYLSNTKKIYDIEIHAYCLMDNHYHLIIRTPRGNISEAMKYLNATYAQYVNVSEKRDGPLFKGRYKAILIGADDYLLVLSRYIHRNPFVPKMTRILSNYKWSSYPAYLEMAVTPDWLNTKEIKSRFGGAPFYLKYKNYVESDVDVSVFPFYDYEEKLPPVIGEAGFKKMINEYVKKHSLSAEIVGANKIRTRPSIESIVDTISAHFEIQPEKIYLVSKRLKNEHRDIAIYICREIGGYPLMKIAEAMGNVTYKAISKSIRRIKLNKNRMSEIGLMIDKIDSF